jgi:hypothetical protein
MGCLPARWRGSSLAKAVTVGISRRGEPVIFILKNNGLRCLLCCRHKFGERMPTVPITSLSVAGAAAVSPVRRREFSNDVFETTEQTQRRKET